MSRNLHVDTWTQETSQELTTSKISIRPREECLSWAPHRQVDGCRLGHSQSECRSKIANSALIQIIQPSHKTTKGRHDKLIKRAHLLAIQNAESSNDSDKHGALDHRCYNGQFEWQRTRHRDFLTSTNPIFYDQRASHRAPRWPSESTNSTRTDRGDNSNTNGIPYRGHEYR